jgi:hypothetical protein
MVRPKEAISNNAVNTDLADLQGCRFVSSSEVEQGQRLSLSRVKYLTGLGQIKARRLRENMITFRPTYKLFLDCNHKPVITDPNDAIWNRVKCIPFKSQILQEEVDTRLPAKLRTELPGILRWIVEGAARYYREGLGDPPDVMAATEQYRQESDRLKEFFEDRCIVAAGGDINSWKRESGGCPLRICTALIQRGPRRAATNTLYRKGSSTKGCRNSAGSRIESGLTAGETPSRFECGSAFVSGPCMTISRPV